MKVVWIKCENVHLHFFFLILCSTLFCYHGAGYKEQSTGVKGENCLPKKGRPAKG